LRNVNLLSQDNINNSNTFRLLSRQLNVATGGTIVDDATYRYHIFTATGTFFTPNDRTADALIIAGGGAGGTQRAGGGGGGGVIYYRTLNFLGQTNYTITVGSGGIGAPAYSPTSGGFSSVSHESGTTVADGGGRGSTGYGGLGAEGGSAGGSSGGQWGSGSTNTSNAMGYRSGYGSNNSNFSWCGGGGGGATSAGVNGEQGPPRGTGGNGFLLDTATRSLSVFSGMTYVSSGGGAGSFDGTCGTASTAGGGNGSTNSTGGNATSYGSGGGGGGRDSSPGGNGYAGIVILRYLR
jgi:hypothetical protein